VPHLIAAPDKFRGTATASELAMAIDTGAQRRGWTCERIALADGGEGLLEAVGGERQIESVTGPLGELVDAEWRLVIASDGIPTAVIEMAQASGLALAGGATRNDPIAASTVGVGELVASAVRHGARRIIVGCGGSATSDGGRGMLAGLGDPNLVAGIELFAATDVRTGFLNAARVFGPQKGASHEDIEVLSHELVATAARYKEEFGVDVSRIPGAGAAGGLAGAVAALGGEVVPGFDLVADLADLDGALGRADLVVTGEGRLDVTSLAGKVVSGVVARVAGRAEVLVIAGTTDGTGARELAATTSTPEDLLEIVSLVERYGAERALAETAALVRDVVETALDERSVRS
jgi:glycerate kinase